MLLFLIPAALLKLQAQQTPLYQAGTQFTTAYQNIVNNHHSFITPYNENNPADTNKEYRSHLYVWGSQSSCLTLKVPHRQYQRSYHLVPDSLLAIPLPYSLPYRFEQTVNRGIFLESTGPVTVVYADNTDTVVQASEITGLLPLGSAQRRILLSTHSTAINPNLRTRFRGKIHTYGVKDPLDFTFSNSNIFNPTTTWISNNLSYKGSFNWFWMHGTKSEAGNNKSGNFASRKISVESDSTYYVSLDPERIYGLDTTFLQSNNPVKVYQFTYIRVNFGTSQFVVGIANEELALPYAMDTAFHFGELAGYEGYVASLQATEDSTRVVINNQRVKYLDKLEGLDTAVSGPLSIRASAPLVGYLANDATDTTGYPRYNNNFTSFFSVAANGDNHLMNESLFATLGQTDGNYHYQLALVCRTADTAQLTLDGSPLPPGSFTIFPGDSLWSYANVEVSRGVHRVACPGGFHGFHYNYYWDPQRPKGLAFSNYGYNLAQNVTWPQDSFYYRVGSTPQSMQPFQNFEQPVLCPGDSLYFYPSQRHHKTWLWDMGDGTLITQKNGDNAPAPLPYAWPEGGTYTVVLRDSVGCAPTDSLQITVQSGQVAGFTAAVQPRCEGFQINLVAQSSGPHQWRYPGGSSSDSSHRFHYTGALQELPITLITGEGNCADTLQKKVVLPQGAIAAPILPNVFTPNGDGVNDAFCITDAAPFAGCFSLQVYNRYGRELFASSDPTQCWQPERSIPQGVYFYLLRIGDQEYRQALHLQR